MNTGTALGTTLRVSASVLIAAGTLSVALGVSSNPHPVELLVIGFGLVATGFVFLRSTRLRASTSILSLLLLWSVIANLCLALRLGESTSFPAR